jgi:hypothetical protein
LVDLCLMLQYVYTGDCQLQYCTPDDGYSRYPKHVDIVIKSRHYCCILLDIRIHILNLNLPSGWDTKQVVDFFKASLEEVTITEACQHQSRQESTDNHHLGESDGETRKVCGWIHIPNDNGPVCISEPVASYTEILNPVRLNTITSTVCWKEKVTYRSEVRNTGCKALPINKCYFTTTTNTTTVVVQLKITYHNQEIT